ncbi:MAG: tetratricopeptide repeat protein [Desulfomonilaceae bacterium]|nr:tetratricopeptide repeat protein [Desulfomonilaceae bacterium]
MRVESLYTVAFVVILAALLRAGACESVHARESRSRVPPGGATSAEQYVDRGKKLLDKGLYAGAARSFSLALKKRPGSPEVHLLRGRAFDGMGLPERAIQDLSIYIQKKPSDPIGYIRRGDAKNFNGMHREAIDDYHSAIRLNPRSVSAYLGRGLAHAGMENYEEAIKDYYWVLRLDPKNREALGNMGIACMLANRPLQAVTYFEQALAVETDPTWRKRINKWVERIVRHQDGSKSNKRGPTRDPSQRPRPMW